ncbi:MAG: restriction endonuclease subunit S [Candidatus Moraniibacteriota bacterium]
MAKNNSQKNIPDGWLTINLDKLATISRGGSPRPIESYITDNQDGLNWLRIGDINPGAKYIYGTSQKIRKEGLSKTTLVNSGDFILSNSMSFGRPYIMKISACIHDGWLALRKIKTDLISKEFLYYLLSSKKIQNEFISISAGSGVQNLKKDTVSTVAVKIPLVAEQERIVSVLESWDHAIEKLAKKIKVKKNIKKRLMQDLLTGKIRLAGFKDEWKTFKLNDVGKTYAGIMGKDKDDFGSGKPFITYMNIYSSSVINPDKCGRVKIDDGENQNKAKYGDLFFTTSSETPEEVGVSSVLLDKNVSDLYLNSFCFGFRLNNFKTLSPEFAQFYFRGQVFRKQMTRIAQGASRYNLSKKYFLDTTIKIPSDIKEQNAIADIFKIADKEIEELNKKLLILKDQKKYLLNNLITGSIRTKS